MHQYSYNKNSLRPWISAIPFELVEIDSGQIRVPYKLQNDGNTPSYGVKCSSVFTENDIIPVEKIQIEMRKSYKAKGNFIPIHNEVYGKTNWNPYYNNQEHKELASISFIKNNLKHEKVYLHFYVEYMDFAKNKYYFRGTYLMDFKSEIENGYKCNWVMVGADENQVK